MLKTTRDRNGVLVYLEDSLTLWGKTHGTSLTVTQLVDPLTGEVLAQENQVLTKKQYLRCVSLAPIGPNGEDWQSCVISGVFVNSEHWEG